jgi:hypothetical protein
MPVTYAIDVHSGIIRTRCVGNVVLSEVLDHFQQLSQDPTCPPFISMLLDLTELTSVPQSSQLHVVADTIRGLGDRLQFGACAIAASRDAVYGMARVFAVFAEPYFQKIAVFRDVGESEVWLAVQSAEFAKQRRERA